MPKRLERLASLFLAALPAVLGACLAPEWERGGQPVEEWSCDGTTGATPSPDGSYYVTSFGCWTDQDGEAHADDGDNCLPWCSAGAAEHGTAGEYDALCGGMSGRDCEESVNWYAAGADRFGCMTRLQVTNPRTGDAAVVVVLDRGPHCRIEDQVDHWVLDLSTPASNYLFGGPTAATERAEVQVEIVPSSTPLGPVRDRGADDPGGDELPGGDDPGGVDDPGGGDAGGDGPGGADAGGDDPGGGASEPWHPAPGTSWQWQLTGGLDDSLDVDMYDVDLFETDAAQIASLHEAGRAVICYFSAGTWEDWRDDRDAFPEDALGNDLPDWPGERWLDVRDDRVLEVLAARLDLAAARGCDGVEPDNVDAWTNDSGFDLSGEDQLAFNRAIARAAHARGLSVGLKNDLEQVAELVDDFDWALVESCAEWDECDAPAPFIRAGKAVFQVEYADAGEGQDVADRICDDANARDHDALVKYQDLDAFRIACR